MEQNENEQVKCGLEAFDAALTNWELSFEPLDETSLMVPAEGRFQPLLTTITALEKQATVETVYPFVAPADRRGMVMALAAWLNFRSEEGAVTVDPDDGSLGFRTHLPIRATLITVTLATDALACHWSAANRVLPGIAMAVFNDVSLEQAIAQCQGTTPLDQVMRDVLRRFDVN